MADHWSVATQATPYRHHYKLDPLVVDTLETNEVWLPITGYATAGTATAMVAPDRSLAPRS